MVEEKDSNEPFFTNIWALPRDLAKAHRIHGLIKREIRVRGGIDFMEALKIEESSPEIQAVSGQIVNKAAFFI